MSPITVALAAVLFIASAATAYADVAAASACAAKLPPGSKLIYDSVAPAIKPDSVIKDVVLEKVRPMVISGQFTRDAAKVAAETAGNCLRLLR